MTDCQYRDGKNCAIASSLAGLDRVTTASDSACDACITRVVPPRARNKVTCDLAIAALRKAGRQSEAAAVMAAAADIYRRRSVLKGVGDHMKDVTAELKLAMKEGCNCQGLAGEMNRLGPDGCRQERSKLVEKLKINAQKYSWGDVATAVANAAKNAVVTAVHLERVWIPNPLDPYGSLLDEAIRRAEMEV